MTPLRKLWKMFLNKVNKKVENSNIDDISCY